MIAELVADEKIQIGDYLQFNAIGRVVRLMKGIGGTYLGVALSDAEKDGYVTVKVLSKYGIGVVEDIKSREERLKKIIPAEVKHEELKSEV